MNATEYLKTEADPDDVIAITTYVDWELHHLTNIMEAYHQRKMESLTEIETLQIVLNWYTKDCSYILQDESGSDLEEILESYLH